MTGTVELSLPTKQHKQAPAGRFRNEAETLAIGTTIKACCVSAGPSLPPPEELQRRIAGRYVRQSGASPYKPIRRLNAALASTVTSTIGDGANLLEFGTGCDRTIKGVSGAYPDSGRFGTDTDPQAIDYPSQMRAVAEVPDRPGP